MTFYFCVLLSTNNCFLSANLTPSLWLTSRTAVSVLACNSSSRPCLIKKRLNIKRQKNCKPEPHASLPWVPRQSSPSRFHSISSLWLSHAPYKYAEGCGVSKFIAAEVLEATATRLISAPNLSLIN